MIVGGRLVGTVGAFDVNAGLGEIEPAAEPGPAEPGPAEPGHEADRAGRKPAIRYLFHCTQIADGSRRIEAGAVVSFRLLPGRDGHWEAADLQPVSAAGSPGSV